MSNSYQEKFTDLETGSAAIKKKLEGGIKFKIKSNFQPSGDQPEAIKKIIKNLKGDKQEQVLLGVTGNDFHITTGASTGTTLNERLRITSEGGVAIGRTSLVDTNILHIKSSADTDFPTFKIETGSTTRDASMSFVTNGGNTFCMGIDASDSDKFKISDNYFTTSIIAYKG